MSLAWTRSYTSMFEWCVRAVVLDLVLDELEARQADRVVRQMVRAARVADRQRRHPEVRERLHPRLKDRRDGLVALQIDAANRAGAVVDVEVAGRTSRAPASAASSPDRRNAPSRILRSEQSLLLAAPETDPHRPAQLDAGDS